MITTKQQLVREMCNIEEEKEVQNCAPKISSLLVGKPSEDLAFEYSQAEKSKKPSPIKNVLIIRRPSSERPIKRPRKYDELVEFDDLRARYDRRAKNNNNAPSKDSSSDQSKTLVPVIKGIIMNPKDMPKNVKPIKCNQSHSRGRNTYRGTTKIRGKRWQSQISAEGEHYYLGTYDSEIEAANMYGWAHLIFYGEKTNIAATNPPKKCRDHSMVNHLRKKISSTPNSKEWITEVMKEAGKRGLPDCWSVKYHEKRKRKTWIAPTGKIVDSVPRAICMSIREGWLPPDTVPPTTAGDPKHLAGKSQKITLDLTKPIENSNFEKDDSTEKMKKEKAGSELVDSNNSFVPIIVDGVHLELGKQPSYVSPILNNRAGNTYRGASHTSNPNLKERWSSSIYFQGKRIYLGRYEREEDAASIYGWAHLILFGEEKTRKVVEEGEDFASTNGLKKRKSSMDNFTVTSNIREKEREHNLDTIFTKEIKEFIQKEVAIQVEHINEKYQVDLHCMEQQFEERFEEIRKENEARMKNAISNIPIGSGASKSIHKEE